MRHAVIMAGGTGTRLWPLSRAGRPKQLLDVVGGRSLLALAYERLDGVVDAGSIYVCTLESHREAVLAALPGLPAENVIGEPIGRDTAIAVGLCATVLGSIDPDATLAFVTADHVIAPIGLFQEALRQAFALVDAAPRLVTFGVVPTAAHTGLGYIERGAAVASSAGAPGAAYDVASFTEKPDPATAATYLASGRYLWNSGVFVWRASTILDQLRRHRPDVAGKLGEIGSAWSGPERARVLAGVYRDLPKISIDYAVLEPASRDHTGDVVVVPLELDWLDVGSWATLATTLGSDDHGNAVRGLSVLVDSSDNIVVTDDPEHLVAAIGLHEMVIVVTNDVTMICPRSEGERVKELVAEIQRANGPRFA